MDWLATRWVLFKMNELFLIVICKVGLDKANKSPDTRLLYVTTGVLKVCI